MIAKKIPLLIVQLFNLNVITPTWCLDHQNQMPNLYLCLDLHDLALHLHPTPSWQALDHITIA
jgi:hypothetical protein